MSTLYDLFKVTETASVEEIKEKYDAIIERSNSLPQDKNTIDKIRRIKIAYGILSDPEKRKKYDLDLATKRADELLEKVQVNEEKIQNQEIEKPKTIDNSQIDEKSIRQEIEKQIDVMTKNNVLNNVVQNQNNTNRSIEDEKAQKKEEKRLKKEQKKRRQLEREMEIQAYGKYLENQGYKVKYPWTWPRVKRLLITIFAIIITCFIMWHIPFVRNTLTDLYDNNFIFRTLANIVISLFQSIINLIKSLFK